MERDTSVVETGAHACAAAAGSVLRARAGKECSEEIARLSPEDFDALVELRVAARRERAAWRDETIGAHVSRRVDEVVAWPLGRQCPLGRLREAWVAYRYGPASVIQAGAAAAGAPRPELGRLVHQAIGLYGAHAEHRPPGWPASGPAALCVLAAQRRADRLAGDVARLLGLARAMRAAAVMGDPVRLAGARARAKRRHEPPPRPARFQFRVRHPQRRGWETSEQRRQRVRDALLLAGDDPAAWPNAALALGHHPASRTAGESGPELVDRDRFDELDGVAARAHRYRDQLARGYWQLPPGLTSPDQRTRHPKEVSTP